MLFPDSIAIGYLMFRAYIGANKGGTYNEYWPNCSPAPCRAGLECDPEDTMTVDGNIAIPESGANLQDIDGSVFGIVTDRYRVVQNKDAPDRQNKK